MLFLAFLFGQIIWYIWLSHELFFERFWGPFIKTQVAFSLEIAATQLVIGVEFLATFFVFEEQVAMFIFEHWVIWRDYELMKRFLYLAKQINIFPAIQIVLRFFIDLSFQLIKVCFLGLFTARRLTYLIKFFIFMDCGFEAKCYPFLHRISLCSDLNRWFMQHKLLPL